MLADIADEVEQQDDEDSPKHQRSKGETLSNEIKKCLSVAQNPAGQVEIIFLMGDGTKQPMTIEKTAISELLTQMSAFNMNGAAQALAKFKMSYRRAGEAPRSPRLP